MTRLEGCSISFIPFPYRPSGFRPQLASRHPPPLTPFTIPALTNIALAGMGDDVDDFVAHIDCPLLSSFYLNLHMDRILDVPQLHQFISRTEKLLASNHVYVVFSNSKAHLKGLEKVGNAEHTHLDVYFERES